MQIDRPIEGTEANKIELFYGTLQKCWNELKEEERYIIVMGDWNARIGKDIDRGMEYMGKEVEDLQNRNEEI